MKKLMFLVLVVIILGSTLISAKVVEDPRYGLLQATKYQSIVTENRIGTIESYDANGKLIITTRKNEGGIKKVVDMAPIATPIRVQKPLRNELAKTNLGKKAVVQQTKMTQGQALQRIQNSGLVSGQVVSESPMITKEQNPLNILFKKVWSFLKG